MDDLDTSQEIAPRPLVTNAATTVAKKATLQRNAPNLAPKTNSYRVCVGARSTEHLLHFIFIRELGARMKKDTNMVL